MASSALLVGVKVEISCSLFPLAVEGNSACALSWLEGNTPVPGMFAQIFMELKVLLEGR